MKGGERDFPFAYAEPEEIVLDETFLFSPHRTENVRRLLEEAGQILSPVWLKKQGGRYVLIDGYARYLWAKEKRNKLPCMMFSESVSDKSLLTWKVLELVSRREPDILEKARIMRALVRFYDLAEIKERFFPCLRIPKKPRMIKTLLLICELSDNELAPVAEGLVSEKTIQRIVWWEEESRKACLKMLTLLRCSVSIQRELVEFLEDLARIEGTTPADILKEPQVQGALEEENVSPRERTEKIRRLLRRRLFPTLTDREERFNRFLREHSLPHGVEIRAPEFFEGDVWELRVAFASVEALRDLLREAVTKEMLEDLREAMCATSE